MLQGQDSILQRIGKVLRAQNDDITDEPVPTRWVDLIHHLNERERIPAECQQGTPKRPQFH